MVMSTTFVYIELISNSDTLDVFNLGHPQWHGLVWTALLRITTLKLSQSMSKERSLNNPNETNIKIVMLIYNGGYFISSTYHHVLILLPL